MNKDDLIKGWIQYLKNNKIVSLQSDPKSGKLNYKQPVTKELLLKFIKLNTELDDKTIGNAINKVIGSKPKQQPSTPGNPTQPTQPTDGKSQPANKFQYQIKNVKSTGTTIPTIPNQPTTAQTISSQNVKNIKEAIVDNPGPVISEKDIEAIFGIIASAISSTRENPAQQKQQQSSQPQQTEPEDQNIAKQQDLEKLTNLITNSMSDDQRNALWRALHEA